MPTTEVIINIGASVLALLGGGGVVVVGLCAYLSKFLADRSIEKHKATLVASLENQKAELNQQLERHRATLNTDLERVKSELSRQSEFYRLKLRKAEILFDRELQAVSDFGLLRRQIRPEYSHPDMDWDEACNVVADRFSDIEKKLEDYLVKHAPVITTELREKLGRCKNYASHNKFHKHEIPEDHASSQARTAAGELLQEIENVEKDLFEMVKNETRIDGL